MIGSATAYKGQLSATSWCLVVAAVLYQLLYVWQGLDFTDTGWHLTAYQQIFSCPESIQYSFMYWLSCVSGGLLLEAWPGGGLLFNRLASVVVHCFVFWLYYKLLLRVMSKDTAVQGLVSSLLFFQFYGFESLNYDSFSLLAFSLVTYLMVTGLWHRRYWVIYTGAVVCGVSTYFRLTNLTALAFLPLVCGCMWLYDIDFRQIWRTALYSVLSYLTGHMIVLGLMAAMGHLSIFADNIALVQQMGADPDYSHNLPYVLYLYGLGWVKIVIGGVGLVLMAGVLHISQKRVPAWIFAVVLLAAAVVYSLILMQYPDETWSKMRYAYLAGISLVTIYILYRGDLEVMVLAVFAWVLMALFPLGANSGVEKMYFGVGLGGALLYQQIHRYYTASVWIWPKRWLLSLFAITCLYYGYTNTYWDPGSRLQKTATVDHVGLRGIHTTAARAASVQELANGLEEYVEEDDYLLAFSDIPMVHYITRARPYILTSWPRLYDSLRNFTDRMEAAEQQLGLPRVVVMHKMEMRSPWPTNTTPTYLQAGSVENRLPQHYEYMNGWLAARPYELVWENEVFMIYHNQPNLLTRE